MNDTSVRVITVGDVLAHPSALSTVLFIIVAILALIFNPPRRKPAHGEPV